MLNNKLDYSFERENELYNCILSHWSANKPLARAVAAAIKTPCSRFWISPEYAQKRISARLRGKFYGVYRPNRERMIDDIMARCDGDFSREKIFSVIYSQAPEYYLSPSTAMAIFCKKRKGLHYECKWRK